MTGAPIMFVGGPLDGRDTWAVSQTHRLPERVAFYRKRVDCDDHNGHFAGFIVDEHPDAVYRLDGETSRPILYRLLELRAQVRA